MALMLLQAVAPTGLALPDQEIVVIAEKLRRWRGQARLKGGVFKCRSVVSTGDVAIDAIGCKAMEVCSLEIRPQMAEIVAMPIARKEKKRLSNGVISTRMGPCVKQRRADGIAELAAQRSGQ